MILDDIKQHIEEKELSFLIGAGFSKNISPKYPSWDGLLSDAIWEMFGKGDRKKNEALVKSEAIRELGYLGIASKMVSNTGYHETIDAYIERHTPFLLNKGGKPVLRINGIEESKGLSFYCHNLLKNLEIQNIYTFNYDNALEFCLGDEKKKQLEKEKSDLEKKRRIILEKHDELLGQIQELERKEGNSMSKKGLGVSESQEGIKLKTTKDEQEKLRNELLKLEGEVAEINSRIPNIQYELENYYQVVKDSSNISLTAKRKNIYKIHGDLRESTKTKYGFDGDNHTQYIITKEDYDTYNEKHAAFVNLMRIDLLRNRFCIVGVSGGDANFLAWINWVKDVLDKREEKEEKSWSYFIYSSGYEMDAAMQQMLNNHFICPVILKDIFPGAKTESERITRFLEYIQPFGYQRERTVNLWKDLDVWKLRRLKDIPVGTKTIEDLLDDAGKNRFHKQSSIVHYKACELQFAVNNFLKRLRIYTAALRCSMMPINLSCGLKGSPALSQSKDAEVHQTYSAAMRRARLLTNTVKSPQKEFSGDPYSRTMCELFNFTSPSEEKLASFPITTGLDYVRLLSLIRFMGKDTALCECKYNKFNSPQELVLAVDYVKSMNLGKDIFLCHKADEYKRQQPLFSLRDYFQSYLKAMKEKNEVQPYGCNTEFYRIEGWDTGVTNAAVILNSFMELGVLASGRNLIDDNDWIELVKLLKEYYPYPLVFYTIARGGKADVVKMVAQELMYSERCRVVLPDIVVKMLMALKSKEMPMNMMTGMAVFVRSVYPALSRTKWSRYFIESIDDYLDYVDNNNEFNLQRAIYSFVGEGLPYVKNKDLNLKLIERVLDKAIMDGNIDTNANSLIVDAIKGLSPEDFRPLSDKFLIVARKVNNRVMYHVAINIMSLLDKNQRHKLLMDIGTLVAKDPLLTDACAYYMKDFPDLVTTFKEEFLKGSDFWKSGIGKDGSISIGAGNVEVSRIVDFLSFNDVELLVLYKDMIETLAKIKQMFKRPSHILMDRGWMSEENVFCETVLDMTLFVNKNEKLLSKEKDYSQTIETLRKIYHQCFFNKTLLQMVSDGKTLRFIRRLMVETEIYGINDYKAEYIMLIGKLVSRDSVEINTSLRHLSWVITKHKSFFNTPDFVTLFSSALDSYAQYFTRNAREWDVKGCEKEVAEKYLVSVAKTMKRWGHPHPFWNGYRRKFFLK